MRIQRCHGGERSLRGDLSRAHCLPRRLHRPRGHKKCRWSRRWSANASPPAFAAVQQGHTAGARQAALPLSSSRPAIRCATSREPRTRRWRPATTPGGTLVRIVTNGRLIKTLPAPLPTEQRAALRGARLTSEPLPPSAPPHRAMRRVAAAGTITVVLVRFQGAPDGFASGHASRIRVHPVGFAIGHQFGHQFPRNRRKTCDSVKPLGNP